MVRIDSLDACFCGALAGFQAHSGAKARVLPHPALESPPPQELPDSTDLPARLAAELQRATGGDPKQCAMAGVAGPVVAAIMGAADGLGIDGKPRAQLQLALLRELRDLARLLGAPVAARMQAKGAFSLQRPARRAAPFDVLLAWCTSGALPTYNAGVHIALGLDAGAGSRTVTDLAWVFRLLCSRTQINPHKEAPVLALACEALCGSGQEALGKLQDVMDLAVSVCRRESMPASASSAEAAGRWERSHSDQYLSTGNHTEAEGPLPSQRRGVM